MPKREDELGDRMKAAEQLTRSILPRRTYTVLRLDGRAFHSYTRGLSRPYDLEFMADMDAVAVTLAEQVAGCRLGYVQSDEISLVLTDFTVAGTQPWFDGQVQKIVSVAAGLASARLTQRRPDQLGMFDARVFTLPDLVDVADYLTWRQRDCVRNSVSMAAQAHFSHGSLHGVGTRAMRERLLSEAGVDWENYPAGFRLGRAVVKVSEAGTVTYTRKDTEQQHTQDVVRTRWEAQPADRFALDVVAQYVPAHPDRELASLVV